MGKYPSGPSMAPVYTGTLAEIGTTPYTATVCKFVRSAPMDIRGAAAGNRHYSTNAMEGPLMNLRM